MSRCTCGSSARAGVERIRRARKFRTVVSLRRIPQAHGRLVGRGPFDPMPAMGWDGHMIAGLQVNWLGFSLEQYLGFALQHDHPLGFFLIVPEAFGDWRAPWTRCVLCGRACFLRVSRRVPWGDWTEGGREGFDSEFPILGRGEHRRTRYRPVSGWASHQGKLRRTPEGRGDM